MLSKKLFLGVAVAVMFGACSKEVSKQSYIPEENEIVLNMLLPQQSTRVTETTFEQNDEIGVYVTLSGSDLQLAGNEVNNEPFVYCDKLWVSPRKVFWNEGLHDVYAYYPYTKVVNDIKDFSFQVQLDQSTDEGYSMSDFLWATTTGVTASTEPVDMHFEHKLSRVIVKLQKGEKFEGDIPNDVQVYIYSTVPNAVIDLSTGDAAKDTFKSPETIRCKQFFGDTYSAIVVPQSLTSQVPLVEIVMGEVSYLMYGKISFRPGYSHTITVTLNQNPEQIKIEIGGDVGGWN